MKNLTTITRGILIGGAFGAKAGAVIGYFAHYAWQWISNLMIAGVITGCVVALAIIFNQYMSPRNETTATKRSNLDLAR